MRKKAAQALGNVGNPIAIEWMLAYVDDPETEVKQAAIEALLRMSKQTAPSILDEFDRGSPATKQIIVVEFIKSSDITLLNNIIDKLGAVEHPNRYIDTVVATARENNVSDQLVTLLLARIGDKSPVMRGFLTETLGQVGGAATSAAVKPLLSHARIDVRLTAANVLGRIGGVEALADLKPLLSSETLPDLRIAAIDAIGQIGGNEAMNALTPLLVDAAREDVLISVINAVARIGGAEAVVALRPLISDGLDSVRVTAVNALGRIGGSVATTSLKTLLSDDNHDVRIAAVAALGRIGGTEATVTLESLLPNEKSP